MVIFDCYGVQITQQCKCMQIFKNFLLFFSFMPELKRKGDWMQTYTGKKFWPLDPRSEEINIEDIAHSLAFSCRFNGHCNKFYSVAQHSVFVSTLVRPSEVLAALLHDSAEAYLGDIISPLKIYLPNILEIEKNLKKIIFQYFDIKEYDKQEIIRADKVALYTEMRDIMGKPPETWKEFEHYSQLLPKQKIVPISPKKKRNLVS